MIRRDTRRGVFFLAGGTVLPAKFEQAIKGRIINIIDISLPRQQAGLLNGMLIGYREGLSQEVTDAFCDSYYGGISSKHNNIWIIRTLERIRTILIK